MENNTHPFRSSHHSSVPHSLLFSSLLLISEDALILILVASNVDRSSHSILSKSTSSRRGNG